MLTVTELVQEIDVLTGWLTAGVATAQDIADLEEAYVLVSNRRDSGEQVPEGAGPVLHGAFVALMKLPPHGTRLA